ncbi:purine-cytosine permease family protein [Leisingera methylohalidivorans]|uniref:Cytosine/uracil/thiamine/allantoin permease n=1 Tax=Leisingera methylohalidivorans DSM 14336 TaxID=999552 RepID=V9VWS1_9RHOB|nr:cytosine permease [Leisingera methylohalidivorans]AHD02174.1 cytosine/uracil/thiamine/allantoin permease [Leisingera methylohalidivorans DSM 14336]
MTLETTTENFGADPAAGASNGYGAAAERGDAPLLPSERLWGFKEFTFANSALAIATWAFLIGGAVGLFVGPKEGIAAIVIGNIFGVVLTALATTVMTGRYGVEQFTALRSQFGYNGSRLVYLLAVIVLTMGWLAVLAMMFGRSIDGLTALASGGTASPIGIKTAIAAVGAILLTWYIVARGPTSIKVFNMIVSPALVLLMVGMLWLIFRQHSFAELMAMEALDPPFEDSKLNFIIAIEVNMAAGFSWWPYIGNLARLTRNERTAFWPNLVGIFGAAVLGEIVGLLAAVSLGDSDPTIWMTTIAGVGVGVAALGFIAFANITSMANILYAAIVGLRQVGTAGVRRIGWGTLLFGFCIVPLLLAVVFPQIYDGFFIFLVWTSALNSALAGIGIADYFFLRRQRLDLRALHGKQENGAYQFLGGFNPIGLFALLVGFVTYVWLFNPQTLDNVGAFRYLTASLPSCAMAGLVHYVLTRLLANRPGWGEYPKN